MKNKTLLILTSGYLGYFLLENIVNSKLKITPFIGTTKTNNSLSKNKANIYDFENKFQIYNVTNTNYLDSKDTLPNVDLILCIDWKKDYFKDLKPDSLILHCHPSLLPKYRGYGVISEQITRGVTLSGLTIYKDNGNIDSGEIIFQEEIKIEHYHKPINFIKNCSNSIFKFIEKIYTESDYKFKGIPQDNSKSIYLPKLRRSSRLIDFNTSSIFTYNFIRAFQEPYSYVYFIYNKKEYFIKDASIESWSGIEGTPGEIIKINNYGLVIACGEGSLLIKEILHEGKTINLDSHLFSIGKVLS